MIFRNAGKGASSSFCMWDVAVSLGSHHHSCQRHLGKHNNLRVASSRLPAAVWTACYSPLLWARSMPVLLFCSQKINDWWAVQHMQAQYRIHHDLDWVSLHTSPSRHLFWQHCQRRCIAQLPRWDPHCQSLPYSSVLHSLHIWISRAFSTYFTMSQRHTNFNRPRVGPRNISDRESTQS